jgi:hypothetical protein
MRAALSTGTITARLVGAVKKEGFLLLGNWEPRPAVLAQAVGQRRQPQTPLALGSFARL